MNRVTDFIFLGSKITVDGDCSHEIKIVVSWKKIHDNPRQCSKKLLFSKHSKMPLIGWHYEIIGHKFQQTLGECNRVGHD